MNVAVVLLLVHIILFTGATATTTYVKKKPIGIHFDVEPYTLPEWDDGR